MTPRGDIRRWLPLAALAAALLCGATRADDEKAKTNDKDTVKSDQDLKKEALALNDLTGLTTLDGQMQKMLEDPQGSKKLLSVALAMTKEKHQPFNRNASILLARVGEQLKEVEPSAAFYRINIEQNKALASEKSQAMGYLGLIEMYARYNKYKESEKVCQEFLDLNVEEDSLLDRLRPRVEEHQARMLYLLRKYEPALRKVDKLIGEDPTDWELRGLKASILREMEKFEEAAKVYLDVIDRAKRDKRLPAPQRKRAVERYRYLLSGVYTDLDKIDKATEQLKALLADNPDHPTYNNDLGYIWADRGMNLEEAEKMIRKALDEDRKRQTDARNKLLKENPKAKVDEVKDNAAYLDSLGWVLFKRDKIKEAKPYLLEAVKDAEGQHTEIFDHLGDVHWALGEKAEALAAWRKGLEAATPSRRDQKRKVEVERKLKMYEGK